MFSLLGEGLSRDHPLSEVRSSSARGGLARGYPELLFALFPTVSIDCNLPAPQTSLLEYKRDVPYTLLAQTYAT